MNTKGTSVAVLSILLSAILILSGCNQGKAESINLAGLLINQDDLPPHWPTSEFSDMGIDKDRSRDSIAISFNSDLYPETFSILQNVYRFQSISDASDDLIDEVEFYTRDYFVPSDWTYSSATASDSYISCKEAKFQICVWIARYQNVVIDLQVPLIPGRMSMNDMHYSEDN